MPTSLVETEWGRVFEPDEIEAAIMRHRPRMIAISHGDTSTTMLQPLAEIGALCRKHDVLLYVDCTASLGGNAFEMDAWQIDVASAGLQKCLSGPPGSAPITFNDRVAALITAASTSSRASRPRASQEGDGPIIRSNYFDLAMLMDYWSPQPGQPPHRGRYDAVRGAGMRPRRAGGRPGARLCAPPARQRRAAGGPRSHGPGAVRGSASTAWPM